MAPDGALWYTGQQANLLGRLDPATGQIREYPLPRPASGPHGLVSDRDGNIWFTGNARGYIGKLDPVTGRVTEYPMPDSRAGDPHTPVFDQKGILWFTVQQGNFIGKLDPGAGEVTLRMSPTPNSRPYGIVVNSQGIPFYCEFGTNKIASINPATMEITEYTLPSGARPRRLTITPDDMVYYSDFNRGYLGRLDPRSGSVDEWRSPAGATASPYGIASTPDGAVWYSEAGVQPNTLVRFNPADQSFEKWPIPSGGGVVRHIVTTPGGQVYLACSGVNRVGIAFVFASESRFSLPELGVLSRVTPGAAVNAATGYARIMAPGATPPPGFAVFSLRQGNVVVSEATVPATAPIRSGRIFAATGPLRTGVALANPNGQPAALSFYFTDANGRDFNPGALTIPANGQVARFLDEPPFSAGSLTNGTWTFSSDVAIAAIALLGHTNERSEFLMTTLPVIELAPRPPGTLLFPQFAAGGGWSTDILLLNPAETTLTGAVFLRASGLPYANFDYSIPANSSRLFNLSASNSLEDPGTVRTGTVRVVPTTGSDAPEGSLVLTLKNGPIPVSNVGVSAARIGSRFHVYVESSQSVQTGIAIANPSGNATAVNLDLISANGEPAGSTAMTIPAEGQIAMFTNEISGLPGLRNFEGMIRLSTASPSGIAVMGLRGRYNERGDFLITSTSPAEEINAAANLFPHIIDGGGYSTQIVLFRALPVQAPAGSLQFYTQAGQPLELSLR
jgi:virginiamycin B lyase